MFLRQSSKSMTFVVWMIAFAIASGYAHQAVAQKQGLDLARSFLINTGLQPGGPQKTIGREPFQRLPIRESRFNPGLKPGVNECASRWLSFDFVSKAGQQLSLEKRVAAEVAQFKGKVSVFAKNLDTGATFSFQGDEPVQTASTIKVAVMIETFARVAEGKAKWTDELVLTKEKKVGGSGILFEFSDGLRLTLRDATTLMMILSDNTATNLVIDTFGADAVNARMEALGFKETRLMRRVFGGGDSAEGKKAESKRFGLGRTSAREMVTLVEKLERGEIISAAVSKEMIDLMKREQGTNGIWRHQWRAPKATKSGALDALRSNVGIIYHPRGRIALAVTAYEMPEVSWTVDNPALLLMNRISEIVIEELGSKTPPVESK
ncbi:MAG TPA: serine hydrolase [Pyrinomonadaceae bacterium]|nr:serine hydrolase [Pyrinomonadaceae bacterium]